MRHARPVSNARFAKDPAADDPDRLPIDGQAERPLGVDPAPDPGHDPGPEVDPHPPIAQGVEAIPALRQLRIVARQPWQDRTEPIEDRAQEAFEVVAGQGGLAELCQGDRHPPHLGGGIAHPGGDIQADPDQDSRPARGHDPLGEDAPELAPVHLHVVGPANPERRARYRRGDRIDHGDRRGQGEPRLLLDPDPMRGGVDADREREAPRVRPPGVLAPPPPPRLPRGPDGQGQVVSVLDDQLPRQVARRLHDIASDHRPDEGPVHDIRRSGEGE